MVGQGRLGVQASTPCAAPHAAGDTPEGLGCTRLHGHGQDGGTTKMPSSNPRYGSWKRRDSVRKWLLATQDVCALCGKQIDKSLGKYKDELGNVHFHPYSPEVDEIIPISKGGSPYDRDNVQLVHRICNQRKGNSLTIANPRKAPLPTSRDWSE